MRKELFTLKKNTSGAILVIVSVKYVPLLLVIYSQNAYLEHLPNPDLVNLSNPYAF